jgi:3-dehydroquinate dehydratase-2
VERILVLNGPNLNLLGERDPAHYGSKTLDEVNGELSSLASELGAEVVFYQSNHEGDIIDMIHEERKKCQGIIINPGALTHYSYSLRDALESVALPAVEVHLSDISSREEWRRESVISPVAWKTISGKGPEGYLEALRDLVAHIRDR